MNKLNEKKLFEYSIIRVVPKVEREEFFNVGVILYCKSADYLEAKYYLDPQKIELFSCEVDKEILENYLQTWVAVCNGEKHGGAIGELPTASRFRWLTATRSTLIQTSKVHQGFCIHPEEKLNQLFEQMVIR